MTHKTDEKRLDVWALLNSMKNHKNYIFDDEAEKEYIPWIVNKSIASFPEYLYHADRMNVYHQIPKKMQYDFYFYSLPKDRRYSKWLKKQKNSDDKYIEEFAKLSNTSLRKAGIAWSVLTDKQRKEIVAKFFNPEKNSKNNK